ncbi:ABC transporter related [Pseudarthrobacter chlorophenolicus A6]|uniref:ABC transporter related n=1 Tax=Pseudarthrobacter chlorophenolicus (strain ATCC 700700 / DSM 12829 / CIP 107037 / JCM 12360 / KCTC 9906 / NCIMB 13794 / A6) TaxID=452863 RepID=B8HDV6_PSECP|nr:zinc ABC transporter ATP-binding protein AztA [Pseudarthrobacter chlorophenolicus]ACL40824.1 ABC transporter related [Pseudarthrobacter chlorophenolicus A6]SDQ74447.1 zinc/manganese transport system ATP-binding protein [Pseudarthrobacter chlorophenolicus]
MEAVRFSNVGYAYPDRQVLAGVSLAFASGTHTVLTGRNGSGKSTLLAMAAGVLAPDSGTVTTHARPAYVIQHIEAPATMPCTVRQAVEMGRWPHRRGRPLRAADRRVVADSMDRMGILELAGRQLRELSGGQRQRTLIAQGLAQESTILLLDEPTAGLDAEAHRLIRAAVAEELRRGVTVLEASHDAADIGRADRVITFESGRVSEGGGNLARR